MNLIVGLAITDYLWTSGWFMLVTSTANIIVDEEHTGTAQAR